MFTFTIYIYSKKKQNEAGGCGIFEQKYTSFVIWPISNQIRTKLAQIVEY